MIPHPNHITTDQAKPTKTQWFCNNCFKPKDALYNDGQFPVCQACLEKRQLSRLGAQ